MYEQNHMENLAKLRKGCTLEEIVNMKIEQKARDPLYRQQ